DREPGDAASAHEVVDFAALGVGGTEVAAEHGGVTWPRPGLAELGRQVLRVGAHVQGRDGVAPDFPGGLRGLQPAEEPALLLCAENGLGWPLAPDVGELDLAVGRGDR